MWVEKSSREVELELELAAVKRELEEARKGTIGEFFIDSDI